MISTGAGGAGSAGRMHVAAHDDVREGGGLRLGRLLAFPVASAELEGLRRVRDREVVAGDLCDAALELLARTPAGAGEAEVNFITAGPTKAEKRAAGSVAIVAVNDGKNATGTFDVTLPDGSFMKGAFDAAFCPLAKEP